MGCCYSRGNGSDVELLQETTNAAVTCKIGQIGSSVIVSLDETTNFYTIQHKGKQPSGLALGSCPLDCDTAMWEVKLGSNPTSVTIGVKRYKGKGVDFDSALDDENEQERKVQTSWFLNWKYLSAAPKEGDVIGIYWDQTDLPMISFSLNGEMLPTSTSINRIRPSNDVHPAVSVKTGASCEVIYDGDNFLFPPKSKKFGPIVCATSLI